MLAVEGAEVDGDGGDAGTDVVVTAVTGMADSKGVRDMGAKTDTAAFRSEKASFLLALDLRHLSGGFGRSAPESY